MIPVWVASAAAMGIAAAATRGSLDVMTGLAAYALGAAALGAMSMGHEYSNHTLGSLLSQPVGRGRIFLIKLVVLAAMLLTLYAMAVAFFDVNVVFAAFRQNANAPWLRIVIASLPALCGLLLAPWLTMLCRSTLAGFVFALAVPAGISMAGTLVGLLRFGHTDEALPLIYGFSFGVLWRGTLLLSAIAAFMSWRTFMRLQAVDGDVDRIPQLRTKAAAISTRRQRPLWLLLKKEVRLQQTTFVFAGLYLAYWLVVAGVRVWVPTFLDPSLFAITMIYGGTLALLIGSLGSAEERQAGTLEWQMLLPMAAWRQWALKVGILLSLALLLTVGLPVLLAYVHPLADLNVITRGTPSIPTAVALVTMAVFISLYVSTLSNSTVKSLLISIAVVAMGSRVLPMSVLAFAHNALSVAIMREWTSDQARDFLSRLRYLHSIESVLTLSLLAIVVGLVAWFALLNHRSAERGTRRTVVQASWIVGALMIGSAVVGLIAVAIAGAVRFPSQLK